jgi:hypothetical protein
LRRHHILTPAQPDTLQLGEHAGSEFVVAKISDDPERFGAQCAMNMSRSSCSGQDAFI